MNNGRISKRFHCFFGVTIVQCCAGIVIVGAGIVLLGWILGLEAIKTFLSGTITMKIYTAICFMLSAIILLLLFRCSKIKKSCDECSLAIFLCSILIFFIMGTILLETFFGVRYGIETFVFSEDSSPETEFPHRASVLTILLFLTIAVTGFLTYAYSKATKKRRDNIFFSCGWGCIVFGTIALIGYLTNIPLLYWKIPDFSNPIAVNTAFLFVVLGIGFVNLRQDVTETATHINKLFHSLF